MIKKFLIFLGILMALTILGLILFRNYTKSFSPADVSKIEDGDFEIEVNYSRPYKKGRDIFGELVPYDKVWRTGANEATLFKTTSDLNIKGNILPKGEYSLWTIPGKEVWQVIWNKETGQWGVDPMQEGAANRNPGKDILNIEVAVIPTSKVFEQFTIDLDKMGEDIHMVLMWENTMVVVPMKTEN